MEFPAHIVFSCLLVCQPAIFVDSKRDGTGAAHGRKKEKKPLRAEWLVHELTDAGKEVWEKDAANKEALS